MWKPLLVRSLIRLWTHEEPLAFNTDRSEKSVLDIPLFYFLFYFFNCKSSWTWFKCQLMFNSHSKVRSALPETSDECFSQHWHSLASAWALLRMVEFLLSFVFDLFCFTKSYFGILFTEYNVNNEIRGHDFKREHREVYGSVWGDKKEENDVSITISQKYNRWLKKEKKDLWSQ